jgi:hypothetical protein
LLLKTIEIDDLREDFFFNYLVNMVFIRNIVFRFIIEEYLASNKLIIYRWSHFESNQKDSTFLLCKTNLIEDTFASEDGYQAIDEEDEVKKKRRSDYEILRDIYFFAYIWNRKLSWNKFWSTSIPLIWCKEGFLTKSNMILSYSDSLKHRDVLKTNNKPHLFEKNIDIP